MTTPYATPWLSACPFALEEDIAGTHRPFEFRDTLGDCYVKCTCGAHGPRDRSPAGAIIGWNARPLEAAAYLRGLEAALGMDQPWPVVDVLTRLADAVEHALSDHNCDRHGHEEDRAAMESARGHVTRIRAVIAKEKS